MLVFSCILLFVEKYKIPSNGMGKAMCNENNKQSSLFIQKIGRRRTWDVVNQYRQGVWIKCLFITQHT